MIEGLCFKSGVLINGPVRIPVSNIEVVVDAPGDEVARLSRLTSAPTGVFTIEVGDSDMRKWLNAIYHRHLRRSTRKKGRRSQRTMFVRSAMTEAERRFVAEWAARFIIPRGYASELTALRIMELAEAANPPKETDDESLWWTDVVFPSKDGWSVSFFYDGESLDYIDSLIAPDGSKIDPWEAPYRTDEIADMLMRWQGVGDLERLRASFQGGAE